MAATVVVAAAGSGKTTHLVDQIAANPQGRLLVTTYTNENLANIRDRIVERFGFVPANVEIETWASTLLRHGVRPYQNLVANVGVAKAIDYEPISMLKRRTVAKRQTDRYFFTAAGLIHNDRMSDFICLVDHQTGGRVIKRLEGIYTHILIDEMQDMSGHDLDFLERLFKSNITLIAVADPRQGTYTTNNAQKHKAAARSGIITWVLAQKKAGVVALEERAESWRCNQDICDFGDGLYPDLPRTTSRNTRVTGHDGIFKVPAADVHEYVREHQPVVLRWNRNSDTLGLPAQNFGIVKGRTFDRVLIFPTKPMLVYLAKSDPAAAGDRAKFYVAVTRARYSVAFVV